MANLRRKRYSFAKFEDALEVPDLIQTQIDSYEQFLKEGLKEVFNEISPIEDFSENLVLEFIDYYLGTNYDVNECRERCYYSAPYRLKLD